MDKKSEDLSLQANIPTASMIISSPTHDGLAQVTIETNHNTLQEEMDFETALMMLFSLKMIDCDQDRKNTGG